MSDDRIFNVGASWFFIGLCFGVILGVYIALSSIPDIPVDDVYRLCMVKDIPLEECKIPPKPYMGASK